MIGVGTVGARTSLWSSSARADYRVVALLLILAGFGFPALRRVSEGLAQSLSTATYGLLLLLLLLVLLSRVGRDKVVPVSLTVVAFAVISWLSLAWSASPEASLSSLLSLTTVVVASILLASRPIEELKRNLLRASLVALLLAVALALAIPDIGIADDSRGALWQGAFSSKNVLGRFAAFAVLNATIIGLMTTSKALRLESAFVCAVGIICTVQSGSAGALVALLIGGLVLAVAVTLRSFPLARSIAVPVAALLVVTGTYLTVLTDRLQDVAFLGRDSTLTGRAGIWQAVWPYILERPGLGWGYGAFFGEDAPTRVAMSRYLDFDVGHAHNFILDLLLNLGLLGIGLWVFFLAIYIRRAHDTLTKQGDPWPYVVLAFVLTSDLIESTSLNGVFPVLLFAVVNSELARRRSTAFGGDR